MSESKTATAATRKRDGKGWRYRYQQLDPEPIDGESITSEVHRVAEDGEPNDTGDRVELASELRLPPATRRSDWEDRARRLVDIVVSALALTLLSPVLIAIAVAIKLDSPGPILYRQLRIGIDRRRGREDETGRRTQDLGGRPFMMFKFRTMNTDAEQQCGPVWAGRNDNRVTRVGRVLRRHRLDELPQFWNVLTGDMSIVGPRPERPSLVNDLRREIHRYQVRQRVRPGITGWAQVNQESDQTVDDVRSKLEYDLEYLERRSLVFDLKIMARTVPVMLEREILEEEGGGRKGSPSEQSSAKDVRRAVGT